MPLEKSQKNSAIIEKKSVFRGKMISKFLANALDIFRAFKVTGFFFFEKNFASKF